MHLSKKPVGLYLEDCLEIAEHLFIIKWSSNICLYIQIEQVIPYWGTIMITLEIVLKERKWYTFQRMVLKCVSLYAC